MREGESVYLCLCLRVSVSACLFVCLCLYLYVSVHVRVGGKGADSRQEEQGGARALGVLPLPPARSTCRPDLLLCLSPQLGLTPLHNAAWKGHEDVAACLVANKAAVDAVDKVSARERGRRGGEGD